MPADIWKCRRTGRCCRLFVFTGVEVSRAEWKRLEKDIKLLGLSKEKLKDLKYSCTLPVVGKTSPYRCSFLKGNTCSIYPKRPKKCKEYPVMVQRDKNSVIFHISDDCLRGKELSKIIQVDPPQRLKRIIGNRKPRVILSSFYEKSIRVRSDEED